MPLPRKRRHPLFDAYGFAVGYAVVDRKTLEVLPIADELLAVAQPEPAEGAKRDLEILPGIAAHAIGFRNSRSMRKPAKWGRKLATRTGLLSAVLEKHNAMLLPGGAHPFYLPARDAKPGNGMDAGARAVCEQIFDLRGHGWSNDQPLRLDVRFDKASEFSKLHAAVRLLLPIIPGLTAASPIREGSLTGLHDARLEAHLLAHERVPELTGAFVPEAVFEQEDHDREILVPIAQALAKCDPDHVLDPLAMNARGATTNFERGAMSIHVIDAQECASANMAVAELLITVLKALVTGRWVSTYLQRAWSVDDLQAMLMNTIKDGDKTVISNGDYLLMFGLLKQGRMPVIKLWQHLFVELYGDLSANARQHIGHILEHGTLAARIMNAVGKRPSAERIRTTYTAMAQCLAADKSFA